jgi:hypothetical protein
MIIAGAVLLVAAVVAVVVAMFGRRRWQLILGTPTSTSDELRMRLDTARGLGATGGGFAHACEVVGEARPGPDGPLTSELTGTRCVWYRYEVTRRYYEDQRDSQGRRSRVEKTETVTDLASAAPFSLADAAGAVLVDPAGGSVDNPERVLDRFDSERSGDTIGYRRQEWVVRAGTQLYVLGSATDRGGDLAVGRPEHGPFIISTRSERDLTERARRTQRIGMAVGAAALVTGLALLVIGLLR